MENNGHAEDLLCRLMAEIQTRSVDMGGKHRYALRSGAHEIITEISAFVLPDDLTDKKCPRS